MDYEKNKEALVILKQAIRQLATNGVEVKPLIDATEAIEHGEQKSILDIEIPFGAKDSELEDVTYYIPKGYHAEIEDNKVVIKKDKQKLVKCLFSNDSYTDEERKVLCDGCKVECELKQKPWSKEDEVMLNLICEYIPFSLGGRMWLKELKNRVQPRSTWKPSDEQMYNLSEAAHCKSAFFDCNILIGLYDELKKLREG